METSFQYVPLKEDEDEIRLITILPYVGKLSHVECSIETVSLKGITTQFNEFLNTSGSMGRKQSLEWEDLTRGVETKEMAHDKHNCSHSSHRFTWGDYAALSYVWGGANDTVAIKLNGQEIDVQRNLEGALRVLSSRAEFHGQYRLWVDALSINQNDSVEKSTQIKKMRTIYGNARAVIGWLGPEGSESGKAIDLIDHLSISWSKGFGKELENRLRQDPEYLGLGNWLALHELMTREYWARLWIIQEIVLGSFSAVLYCGNRCVEWTRFCQAIGFLFEYLWTAKDMILAHEVQTLYPTQHESVAWSTTSLHLVFRDLWMLSYNEAKGGDDHLSFGQLLDLANSGGSKDPRDKVYGLVGMMDPLVARNVVPNYSLLPGNVYAAIARTYIIAHGNLEAIREGNPWGELKSPSWAADWTWASRIRHGRVTANIWGPFWGPKGEPPSNKLGLPYCASGDVKMQVRFSDDGIYLGCQGFIVDEVNGLSAREDGYFAWASSTIHQSISNRCAYEGIEGISEALYKTLVLDRVSEDQRANAKHSAILNMPTEFSHAQYQFESLGWSWLANQRGYYFRWSEWRKANRGFLIFGKPLDCYLSETIPEGSSEYDYTEAYSCNNRTSQGRRFITTTNGYMGWGPDNMFGSEIDQIQPGDKIAIIFGCSTPILIRQLGEVYQVLGEAYVHGLMDGEGLHFLESGQSQVQQFIFC
ncbi:heterokaryon incompatibility protein-domain-containing protein [Rhexocercosporidium sp. MPI-PUGE-AT-0058]|nr:heterokaryon incompatibility protein-domain-containing protein [Rhexocercosporidium sp. MPI-PUGE-AT-0058]